MTTNNCTFCKSSEDINRHHIIPRRYGTQISCGSFYVCKKCHLICEKYAVILVQTILHNRVNLEILQKNVIEYQEQQKLKVKIG